ncbi:DUF1707 and FHA domain-containing protein [Kribbella kalugense]|uniref:Uncharacterized protein DUF1707 n=1 Tax=Kribbella kalugense TaxID=2512221 RepID=A0A4V3G8G0_9ACTN|nr:DUF1707 and FHA domain-containing protein [Kribbella kalugense]TDW22774.1 uncharacterized protein DUF1707 [Kribbella kalugense]
MTSVPVEGTRPSDAERDRALAVLRDGAGSGRLSHDTFIRRMNFVLRAQSRGELADAIRDLPRSEPRQGWTRNLRGRLPRLKVESSASPNARTGAHQPRPAQVARRAPRFDPVGVVASWLDALPRFSFVRQPTAVPLPALALPAPGTSTVRIGRGPGATLRLADVSVSRFHAELRHVDDGWMVRDLGSMNGTCVNDLRITTTARVRPGDRVSFGAVAYVLTWTD